MKTYRRFTTPELIKFLKEFKFTRQVTQLHVHHTYSPSKANFNGYNHDALNWGMEQYHMQTNGWSAIAQQLTLFPDGIWLYGRDFNQTPASILGWNTGSICIEIVGDFDKGKEALIGQQAEAIYEVCEYFVEKMGLTMKFHRDSPTAYKTCPGSGIDRATFFSNVANYSENSKAKVDVTALLEAQKRVEELKKVMETTRILFNDMIVGKNTDHPKVHWSNDFVNLATDLKIVKGYPSSDGKGFDFKPDNPITRAEAVTLIMKAYESLEEKIAVVQKSIEALKK